jgi:ClpP class serine protease
VWTGVQAEQNGLIDGLGDLQAAIAKVKEAAEIDADEEVTLVHLPRPEGFLSQLLGMNVSTAPQTLLSRWMSSRIETMGAMERGRWSLMEVAVP